MQFLELRVAKCHQPLQTTFQVLWIPQRPKILAKLFFSYSIFNPKYILLKEIWTRISE